MHGPLSVFRLRIFNKPSLISELALIVKFMRHTRSIGVFPHCMCAHTRYFGEIAYYHWHLNMPNPLLYLFNDVTTYVDT